jgi:hypothetical protein
VEQVKKVRVVARILDRTRVFASEDLKGWERSALRLLGLSRSPRAGGEIPVREYSTEDLPTCASLLNSHSKTAGLALVWEEEELGRELDHPDVSRTLVYEKGGEVAGLINYLLHDHHGKTVERWAWLNHVAMPDLTAQEKADFVRAFLVRVKEAGCVGVTEWTRGYYSLRPLLRARFFPYMRALNMHAWKFNEELDLQNISKVYEVQI